MEKMTHRERALKTFAFEQTDRPAFDLMENAVWPELAEFFSKEYNLNTTDEILDFLDSDFRWAFALPEDEDKVVERETFADDLGDRFLGDVESVADLDKKFNPQPEDRVIPDFKAFREKYPEHSLIFCPLWMPGFSGACQDFGMVNALCKMATDPEIIKAYVTKLGDFAVDVLQRGIKAGAAEYCDFYWMGDDFAGESALMLSPDMWREIFKPAIARQVRIARDAGLRVLFHSCGAVESVYEDFIEMGINAHCGVQTSAKDMDIENLAKKYGGRFVIYGGVDAQTTLIHGSVKDTEEAVKRNINAFRKTGGYVVSNSHHGLPDIKGENLVAMARTATSFQY